MPADFSPEGHSVLELGGHIGSFAVWAIMRGAREVRGFEPHPENAELYRANTRGLPVALHEAAVVAAAGSAGADLGNCRTVELALGKDFQVLRPKPRFLCRGRWPHHERGATWQGVHNTWRHSLLKYSHYAQGKGDGSMANRSTLTVAAVPFSEALIDQAQPRMNLQLPRDLHRWKIICSVQVTFVKMDCEGAEIDILEAQQSPEDWRNVRRLVFEYRLRPFQPSQGPERAQSLGEGVEGRRERDMA